MIIDVKIDCEAGYESAKKGLSTSFFSGKELDGIGSPLKRFEAFYTPEKSEKMGKLICDLNERAKADDNDAHSKVLRQMMVWVLIAANDRFWAQCDQYKVGTVTQSASIMHTGTKRILTCDDFSSNVRQETITFLNGLIENGEDVNDIGENMAKGFLQLRMLSMNYANIQDMIIQRTKHKLKAWDIFLDMLKSQLQHPEVLIWDYEAFLNEVAIKRVNRALKLGHIKWDKEVITL